LRYSALASVSPIHAKREDHAGWKVARIGVDSRVVERFRSGSLSTDFLRVIGSARREFRASSHAAQIKRRIQPRVLFLFFLFLLFFFPPNRTVSGGIPNGAARVFIFYSAGDAGRRARAYIGAFTFPLAYRQSLMQVCMRVECVYR